MCLFVFSEHINANNFSSNRFIRIDLRTFSAVGRGTLDFLPRELGELDLEKYIVDVSTRKSIQSCYRYTRFEHVKIVFVNRNRT